MERVSAAVQNGNGPEGAPARRSERGAVVPLLLGSILVLMTVSMGVFTLSEKHSRTVAGEGKRLAALSLAEGGVDHVMWRLRQTPDAGNNYGPNWRDLGDERDVSLPGGTYYLKEVETEGANGPIKGIRMQGWIPSRTAPDATSAELYVEVKQKPETYFGAALIADEELILNGNPGVDSYKSSRGTYNSAPKYDNGDVINNNPAAMSTRINGNVDIRGHLYYAATGSPSSVSINGNGGPTKGIDKSTADTSFKPIPDVPMDAIYVKPVVANGNTDVAFVTTSNDTLPTPLPAGTYVITKDASGASITLNGNSRLRLAGTAQTVLYLEGNAKLNGNGIVNEGNRPTTLQIYGMPFCNQIIYSGNVDFYGAIYGPQADITLNGNCDYLGSIMGQKIRGNGNIDVHYDEDLGQLGGGPSAYQLASWTQTK